MFDQSVESIGQTSRLNAGLFVTFRAVSNALPFSFSLPVPGCNAISLVFGAHPMCERKKSSWPNVLIIEQPLVQRVEGLAEKLRVCEIHSAPPRSNCCKRWLNRFPTRSKRIDVISRISFPVLFAVFNLFYWTTYLFRDDIKAL